MNTKPEIDKASTAPTVKALNEATQVLTQGFNMNDFTVAPANKAITVPFHGTELYVVEHNGQPYTPMKPIVEGIGLDWGGQHKKVAANESRWGISVMEIPSAGGAQSATCIMLRKLPAWLATIDAGRVKNPEVRARVIQYQNECDDALWQYWNDGMAINPRTAYAVNPGDKLTAEEAETLRLMLKSAVDRQPKEKQGALMMQGWSKLKAHFKVGYREIPRHEFSEAVSIIARHTAEFAEWEVADDEQSSAPTMFGRQWLVSTDMNGKETVRPVAPDQFVKSFREIARGIAVGDMELSTAELIDLASACNQRLVHRLGNPALVLAV